MPDSHFGPLPEKNLDTDAILRYAQQNINTFYRHIAFASASFTGDVDITGSLSGLPWTSWTPGNTNITIGDGTQTGRYVQLGDTVHFWWSFTLGSTSAIGAGASTAISLPVTAHSGLIDGVTVGHVRLRDANAPDWAGPAILTDANTLGLRYVDAASNVINPTTTLPFTWVATDILSVSGTYEAA
jgi:hypothetical protein